jgi:hypothetical protein
VCTAAEVDKIISNKIKPIEDSIKRIENSIEKMPCQDLLERVIRSEMKIEELDRSSEKFELEKNTEVYPRLRDCETDIATLTQQNKDQDGWSAKTWAILLMIINFIFGVGLYLLVRS